MPTYVYACSSCHDTYEVEQRITENALTDCRCGSIGTLKRVIQPVGIAFKGSGFYVNDNASKSSMSAAPSSSSTTSTATETKTEAPAACPAPAACANCDKS